MSRYIATRAIRGANSLVSEAELMLDKALTDYGAEAPVAFPNTAYYIPLIYGMTGSSVETLGQLQPAIEHARNLLHPVPSGKHWTPYLGETLDSGMATLIAAETIEAIRYIYKLQPEAMPGFQLAGGTSFTSPDGNKDGNGLDGHLNGPIDDIQLRSWASSWSMAVCLALRRSSGLLNRMRWLSKSSGSFNVAISCVSFLVM